MTAQATMTGGGRGRGPRGGDHAVRPAVARGLPLLILLVLWSALLAWAFADGPGPDPAPATQVVVAPADWIDPTFGRVPLYHPAGPPRRLVLFLSGDGGWRGTVDRMARMLAGRGVLVAGLSTARLLHHVETEARGCARPDFPLLGLAADIEHRLHFPRYEKPFLLGYSAGATLAYGTVAQAPGGSYAGVASIAFSPDIVGTKPWCPAPGLSTTRIAAPAAGRPAGWLFAPHVPSVPWTVIQGDADHVVDHGVARGFASAAGARFVSLPGVDHRFADPARWAPPLVQAVLGDLAPVPLPADMALPTDLPLTPVVDPAAPPTDVMAVLYSGDGGWAGLDRDVAAQLAARGVPVVGVDSLAYFWTARTPAGAGRDLARILADYGRAWHRRRIVLIGYSFGADALPHIVPTLPPSLRMRIDRIGLIGLGTAADFQFHLGSWLDMPSAAARPTVPAVLALRGTDMLCLYGADEGDSACPLLPAGIAHVVRMPGGHHLGNDPDGIVAELLSGMEA